MNKETIQIIKDNLTTEKQILITQINILNINKRVAQDTIDNINQTLHEIEQIETQEDTNNIIDNIKDTEAYNDYVNLLYKTWLIR